MSGKKPPYVDPRLPAYRQINPLPANNQRGSAVEQQSARTLQPHPSHGPVARPQPTHFPPVFRAASSANLAPATPAPPIYSPNKRPVQRMPGTGNAGAGLRPGSHAPAPVPTGAPPVYRPNT